MLFSFRMFCLLVMLLTTAAGCASAQSYRTPLELPQRKAAIRNVGLLPPMIKVFEEQVRFNLVLHDDWSREATESLRKAFVDEMAADRLPLTVISGESHEVNDMADLFKAVDFSIGRHAYDNAWKETFPEKVRSFDYSLGPAREMMEQHQVDAVWIVTGYNLLPTLGAQWTDAFNILLAINPYSTGPLVLTKVEFRAALVNKSGTILFYYKEWPFPGDLRDPNFARPLVRELLSEYRNAVAQ